MLFVLIWFVVELKIRYGDISSIALLAQDFFFFFDYSGSFVTPNEFDIRSLMEIALNL
jgi:hypothetical protein